MAYFDPSESFEIVKKRLADTIKSHFPVVGAKHTLEAKRVWFDDTLDPDDVTSQKDARVKGTTWGVPIKAELQLKDTETGKVIHTGTVPIGKLPKITRRYSYIVNGDERQPVNQLRLKSGVYTRIKKNGQLAAQWNLAKGMGFQMNFNPATRRMDLQYQNAHVPLYPVLKTLGVSDADMHAAWGKEVYEANAKGKHDRAIHDLHMLMTGKEPASLEAAQKAIRETFDKTELRSDSTKVTLGHPFDRVTGKALMTGTSKILKVSRNETEPDDRDSLEFKDLLSTEDLLEERVSKDRRWQIAKRLKGAVDRHRDVREIVSSDTFGPHVSSFFTNSTIVERPDQINPVSFWVGNRKTTLGGEHGIEDEHKLTVPMQSVNPSHMAFLDAIQTPESGRVGSILQLSLAAQKVGRDIKVPAHNLKTGKDELIDPYTARWSNVAFPDQYHWKDGKPHPIGEAVKVSDRNGDIVAIHPRDVHYVLKSTKGMFDLNANLVPFLSTDQGNRAMMATKQMEQAAPLIHRAAPLVMSKGEGDHTFEEVAGRFAAHVTPHAGVVTKIDPDGISIKTHAGERVRVPIYNDFPLNNSYSMITSEPIVKVGDTVKAGQVVADSNFTKNGTLAIGTPLRVAYMPYRGYNYDDGVVISETAAKKLTSQHLFRNGVEIDKDSTLDKRKFDAHTRGQYTTEQLGKLDDDAVIREGQEVKNGDVLIGRLKREQVTPEQLFLGKIGKRFVTPVRPHAVVWEHDHPGVVSKVVRHRNNVTVYVKTNMPMDIGDKLAGRHGNKGVVTLLVPDAEMPQDSQGRPMEVLLNPSGVPSRMNVGQVLETAAGKIAEKTGKPYLVNNFDPTNTSYVEGVKQDLKRHGISDVEDLHDPKTGQIYKDVLTGPQHIQKLQHIAEFKMIARSRGGYDVNLSPKGGHPAGGGSMDAYGLYALLAHGAKHNIREAQTVKSEMSDDVWSSLQEGTAIPVPKIPPFVYRKFESYLKGMGVNVTKEGNSLHLSPLTDHHVLKMSNGELVDPGAGVQSRTLKPLPGGIYDPKVTGTKWPDGRFGDKWSHITLGERMPNPVFEKPIQVLLGLSGNGYDEVIKGERQLAGKTGVEAIVHGLGKINVGEHLPQLEQQALTARGDRLDTINKKIKYMRALQRADMSPHDAYTQLHVPVLPPSMHPAGVLDGGDIRWDDLSKLYMGLGKINHQLKTQPDELPEYEKNETRAAVYDGLKALTLIGATKFNRHLSGIAETIAGTGKGGPKVGFFQDKVMGKRQDMSARALIVPEPSLHLDEVAIPRKAAMEMYKPFVTARMARFGITPGRASELIRADDPTAHRALEREIEERPILLKRDPVLHKYGIQAFRPKLTDGYAVKIHPLVTAGYNADFDGDMVSAFVPVGRDAVEEARKMFPSNNLFSPSTGALMYAPKQEALLGLFELTKVGPRKNLEFKSAAEAARAAKEGKISLTDAVRIHDPHIHADFSKLSEVKHTTVGRIMVYHALPEKHRDPRILTDPSFQLDKKTINSLLSDVASKSPGDFATTADRFKELGNRFSTGLSIGLDDFTPISAHRNAVLADLATEEARLRRKDMPEAHRKDVLVSMLNEAKSKIDDHAKKVVETRGNRMYNWAKSGAKGTWGQFSQMVVAPMLVADSKGKVVPVPIGQSYAEGLDIANYWAANIGARMGTIGRALGTSVPGEMSKQMITAAMNQVVVSDDCGTNKGIALPVTDHDVVGRFTAKDLQLGPKVGKDKGEIPAGTLVTPELLNRLRNNKITEVTVRTPLKCQHGDGICAKCYGHDEHGRPPALGANMGVIAAHALGEPMSQLSMNAFHMGGSVGAKGTDAIQKFERLKQLLHLPAHLPNSAVLSTQEGTVTKIEKDPAGGWGVHVGDARHYVPSHSELLVRRGDKVQKGGSLSSGHKNPLELLPLTNLGTVQRYLADELKSAYEGVSPVRRRNVETFVRVLTNLSVVNDPGDHPEFMKGDFAPTSEVNAFNSRLEPNKRPVRITSVLKGTEALPLELHRDWLADMQTRDLRRTLMDAAAEGWKSNLHGTHPIPGMAYGITFGLGTPDRPWAY